MKVVHNVTQVMTEFLLIDDDGNVIDRRRGQNETGKLTKEEFDKIFDQLIEFREQYRIQTCPPDSE